MDAHAAPALRQAVEKLDRGDREVVLDFSAIDRIDPSELKLLEKLAGLPGEQSVKVALRGVNVRIYKTLKLADLTGRFSFEK
jgi:anti-anti-sigma regulatory factor